MRGLMAALVAATVLLPCAGGAGPLFTEDTLQRYFRLDWDATPGARGPQIAGYVENTGNVPVDRMRLLVEHLDAGGVVTTTSTTWVMGVVTPNHRSYFTTRVAAAAAYRVRILSFDWPTCRD